MGRHDPPSPRPIQGFLKKDELALMIQRRNARNYKTLAPENIDHAIVERFYQHRAIRRAGRGVRAR
jgi:type I restriction enzyme, R subunit